MNVRRVVMRTAVAFAMTLVVVAAGYLTPAVAAAQTSGCGLPESVVTETATAGVTIGCGEPAETAETDSGVGQSAVAAAGASIVITFPTEPAVAKAVTKLVAAQQASGVRLSDAISTVLSDYTFTPPSNGPKIVQDTFDGTLTQSSTGLVMTISTDEIRKRSLGDWWKPIVGMAVGFAAGVVAYGACVLVFAEAAPLAPVLCSTVRGFMTGFVGSVITQRLKGISFLDKALWVEAFAAGVVGGALGAAWDGGAKEWLTEKLRPLMKQIGNQIAGLATSIAGWAGQAAAEAVDWAGGQISAMSNIVVSKILEVARRSGLSATVAKIRLMPLGDSITHGIGSSTGSGYRARLFDTLALSKRDVDAVGSQSSGDHQDPSHEGYPGWRIDQLSGIASCAVRSARPNVITIHAGTNDMNQQFDLARAPERLDALIDRAFSAAPEATVVVATLIAASKPGLQPRIDAYNAKLPGLVKARQAQGDRVKLADMSAVTTADLAQPAHPSDRGYAKMADAFLLAILEAESDGWIGNPVPGTGQSCDKPGKEPSPEEPPSKAGPGWRSLGTIAPGLGSPEGKTDLVDLDGDRRDDYVRIAADGSVRAALNTVGTPGSPDWVDQGIIVPKMEGRDVTADMVRFADVNGDGLADYLVVRPDASVEAWINSSSVLFKWSWVGVIAPGIAGMTRDSLRFADVNGDGRDDYLRVSEDGAVHAYLNRSGPNGRWTWEPRLNWAPGVNGATRETLRLADVSGDGKTDYLIVRDDGAVDAYINRGGFGQGGFEKRPDFVYETGYDGAKSRFRDISGDGKADYVVIYDGGSIRAWLNRGGNG